MRPFLGFFVGLAWLGVVVGIVALGGCQSGPQVTETRWHGVTKHCDEGNRIYIYYSGIAVVPGGCK